jgi:hypothetical protein
MHFISFRGLTAVVGQGVPSPSYSYTPHSVGLLGLKQRLLAENTQHSHEKDIHVSGGIRTRNPNNSAAVDPRLRPRGHEDRLKNFMRSKYSAMCADGDSPNVT